MIGPLRPHLLASPEPNTCSCGRPVPPGGFLAHLTEVLTTPVYCLRCGLPHTPRTGCGRP